MPKVSILLTSYNHEKFLMESIQSILNQSFTDFELYIVDDCSTDSSWEIISSIQDERVIKIRNEMNLGEPVSADFFKKLKGEYYAIAHCDDKWHEYKLEKQVSFLDEHPEIGACFTDVELIDQYGRTFYDSSHHYYHAFYTKNQSRYEWLRTFFYTGNRLCQPSSLIRTKIRVEEDVFVYGLASLPDLWRWIEICLKHEIYILPEKLTYFRILNDQANTSGINPSNMIRLQSEYMLIGNQFFKIPEKDLFKVFPDAQKYRINDNFDKEYILSKLMIDSDLVGLQACGINHLYDLLNQTESRLRIQELYSFTATDFKRITNSHDIFKNYKEEKFLHISLYYWNKNNFNENQVISKIIVADNKFKTEFDLSNLEFDHLRLDLDEGVYRKFSGLRLLFDGQEFDYKIMGWHEQKSDSIFFYTTDPQIHIQTNEKIKKFSITGQADLVNMYEVQKYIDNKTSSKVYTIADRVLKIFGRKK